MAEGVALEIVIEVWMGVHMHDPHPGPAGGHGPQDRIGHRMVSAQGQQRVPGLQHRRRRRGDPVRVVRIPGQMTVPVIMENAGIEHVGEIGGIGVARGIVQGRANEGRGPRRPARMGRMVVPADAE